MEKMEAYNLGRSGRKGAGTYMDKINKGVKDRPNIVVVVVDTLRTAYLGCCGNRNILTPNIDAFAGKSVRFTRAYPESLPTIPVRRALFTGRRVYPFNNYRPLKDSLVYLPGWQAMFNEEDTVAENLKASGYHTGFVADSVPYFSPGLNFYRGFMQWEFIRGQMNDKWASPFTVSDKEIRLYGVKPARENVYLGRYLYLANRDRYWKRNETTTERVFKWGMEFLEDNRKGRPFYLLMDSFAPHEMWEAPEKYFKLYGARKYDGIRRIQCDRGYGPMKSCGYAAEEVEFIKANYSGLVTLVDEWFGKFMAKLKGLGLSGNTYVFLVSDHGTNFCENKREVLGKAENAMYPGVMDLVMMLKSPDGAGKGKTNGELVYNIDLTASIYDAAGIKSKQGIDGRSLLNFMRRGKKMKGRKLKSFHLKMLKKS
mgnify:CR=1 FL=1